MQLYAKDKNSSLIYAGHAVKQTDYLCLECDNLVRLRGGVHRQPHFFHLADHKDFVCRQQGKSMAHLHAQLNILEQLPRGEAFIEYRFPQIKRVADVAWHARKLIFEIQCSPISNEEIEGRFRDYKSLGYHVIWILHDNRYNQKFLSSAEKFLETHPCYYTNINSTGEGEIYDQPCVAETNFKRETLPKRKIDLMEPRLIDKVIGRINLLRYRPGAIYFKGDLVDAYISNKMSEEEKQKLAKSKRRFTVKVQNIFLFYKFFFRMLLERACK